MTSRELLSDLTAGEREHVTYLTAAQIAALYAMRKAAPALAVRTIDEAGTLVVIAPDLRAWHIDHAGSTVAPENTPTRRTTMHATSPTIAELLESPAGRYRLVQRRAELVAAITGPESGVGDAISDDEARRRTRALSDFDRELAVATGVVSRAVDGASRVVTHRGTGERGELLELGGRSATGFPLARVLFDGDGPSGSIVYLVDLVDATDR